ncbi:MAG: type IV toxin-antitoxin system AbiEi family antitoxin domain-containing protein [Solirubrobacteraceae bacterium]
MAHVVLRYPGKGERPHPDEVIAELASGQAGIVARRQLAAAGLTRNEIDDRLASGHLRRVHRGVYAAGHAAFAPRSSLFAACLAFGPGAAVARDAAAAEHDLRRNRRAGVDVIVPRHARPRRGVRVHRGTLTAADVVIVDGLPVTSWARTILDLAAGAATRDVTRLLERAEKIGVYDGRALDDLVLRSNGHRGCGVLRRAILEIDPRHAFTRSGWERDVLPILDDLGLPRPAVNHQLGPYEFDLHFEREGVVVELDSWEHHSDRDAFEADRARDRWLAARGLVVLRFTWRQVQDGALSELSEVLRQRGAARSPG